MSFSILKFLIWPEGPSEIFYFHIELLSGPKGQTKKSVLECLLQMARRAERFVYFRNGADVVSEGALEIPKSFQKLFILLMLVLILKQS